jgi:L-asparaginase
VEILMSFVGASGATVRALCAERSRSDDPVQGIIVAGTGNGSLHADLELALRQAQTQGVGVVRATRCSLGQIVSSAVPVDALPHSNGLSPVKARIALMLALMAKK